MNKAIRKDFFREIKKSTSRFISIMLIVALGVAFFAGLRSASPAMKDSVDAQYDKENIMDIRVVGTLGLTESDLNKIREIKGVSEAEGSYTTDLICHVNSKELVTKAISMPQSINDVKCTEGRYPEKYNECLASREFLEESGLQIGDFMTLKTGTSESIFDTLATETYTIVGVCTSAIYLNGNMGTATIGDGVVDGYVVIPKESFATDVFTSIYVTLAGAKELNCFGSAYSDLIDDVTKELKSIAEVRSEIRYSEVRSKTAEMLTKATNEYNSKKAVAESELSEAYEQLLDSEEVLNASKSLFEEKKKMLEDAETEIPLAKQKIAEAKKSIENLKKLRSAAETSAAKAEQEAKAQYDEWKRLSQSGAPEEQIKDAESKYNTLYTLSVFYKEQVIGYTNRINSAAKEIQDGEQLIKETESSLNNKDQILADTEKQLQDAEIQLQRGKEQYEISKADAVAEFSDAELELRNAQTRLNNMEVPEWYILDRSSIESYAGYLNDAQSIASLGSVFPLIFFIVAALVCLTTMTRMVAEQRTQIGTLKAMGYTRGVIIGKYLLYALIASLFGSILGTLIGEFTIPGLIVRAYKMAYYNLTETVVKFNFFYAILASLMAVLCTTLAAFAACRKELKSVPAALMRPEAPKNGKRILIERIKPIWERLDFAQKAACRNLFRYKRRFFMTLFGVGGCMALLLVGFGINDSVSSMASNQYGDIFKYDGVVTVDGTITRAGRRAMLSDIQDIADITDFAQVHRSIIYSANNADKVDDLKYAYLVVPTDSETFENFVSLRPRGKGGTSSLKNIISVVKNEAVTAADDGLALEDNGVIITEKYAELLGVKIGDSIFIRQSESDSLYKEVKVLGITENYMFNYVYMSRNLYNRFYDSEPDANLLMVKFAGNADTAALTERVMKIKGINSVTLNEETLDDVNEMTGRLVFIIIMMIVAAALLAFVVIYNLNNINISERRRELATLKLLGFYDNEVAKYVYRENIVLTVLGTVLGIFLGIILHKFVMSTVETDVYMFGRSLKALSILISAVLTVIFSMLVNVIMYFKLKKIDMVESLKSVE